MPAIWWASSHGYRRLPPKQGKLNRRIQSQSFLQLIGLGAIQMEKVGPAKGNGELGGFRSTQGGGRFEPAVWERERDICIYNIIMCIYIVIYSYICICIKYTQAVWYGKSLIWEFALGTEGIGRTAHRSRSRVIFLDVDGVLLPAGSVEMCAPQHFRVSEWGACFF